MKSFFFKGVLDFSLRGSESTITRQSAAPVPGWHQGWVKLKQSKKSNKFYGSYKVVYPGATRRQDRECYQELALGNYGAAGGGAQTWVIIQQRP